MNYKEIKSSIKDHTASLYVFYGEEVFLRDYVTSMLIKKVVEPDFADFNYLVLTNETANIETVADFFEAYPFAAERKLIHIKDANIFSGKADGKDDWLRLLSSIPDYVTVLITEDTIDKRLTTYKALSKVGEFAEFAYLERFDIKAHVSKKLTQSKKEMKAQDVDFFLDLCGPDLTGIRLSLDKLIAYSGENTLITRADIENNITPPLLNRIYDISEAILSKNSDYALKLLGDLKKSGEPGLRVLAVISGYFQDLYRASVLSGENLSYPEMVEAMKLPPNRKFIADKMFKRVRTVKASIIRNCIADCCKAESDVKNGFILEWQAIDLLVLKFLSL